MSGPRVPDLRICLRLRLWGNATLDSGVRSRGHGTLASRRRARRRLATAGTEVKERKPSASPTYLEGRIGSAGVRKGGGTPAFRTQTSSRSPDETMLRPLFEQPRPERARLAEVPFDRWPEAGHLLRGEVLQGVVGLCLPHQFANEIPTRSGLLIGECSLEFFEASSPYPTGDTAAPGDP